MNGDRAIVIGVDGYRKSPSVNLKGAVRDALAFAAWLMDKQGGGLDRSAVTLLMSPSPSGAQPTPDQVDGPADVDALVGAIKNLRALSDGRRLYVYFAGHGCRTDSLNSVLTMDALLFEELNRDNPARAAVGVQDLCVRLRLLPFREVILITDACRNYPFATAFQLAGLGLDEEGRRTGLADAYQLMATAAGEVSRGDGSADDVRGVFGRALTEALAGGGAAKSYDDSSGIYQVSWRSLCDHLARAVPGQKLEAAGGADLVFATFPDGWFAEVPLTVTLHPGPVQPVAFAQARVRVTYPQVQGDDDGGAEGCAPFPVRFEVPPRRIRVKASAGDYVARASVPAYGPVNELSLTLAPPPPPYRAPDLELALRGPSDRCYLEVVSPDPADVLQVRMGDTVVRQFVGTATVGLEPGSYTITVPRGVEQVPVDLARAGTLTTVTLHRSSGGSAPVRLARALEAGDGALLVFQDRSGQLEVNRDQPVGEAAHVLFRSRQGTALWLPVLPDVVTVAVVEADGLVVRLYDVDRLDDPLALALLDRAQQLRGVAEPGVVELLAAQPAVAGSRVAQVLTGDPRNPRLQSGAAPALAHRLLGPSPWAVYAGAQPVGR